MGKNNFENQLIRIRPMAQSMLGNPSNSTIYRWMKLENFPKPIKLSPSFSAWNVSEVEEWIENRERITRVKGD